MPRADGPASLFFLGRWAQSAAAALSPAKRQALKEDQAARERQAVAQHRRAQLAEAAMEGDERAFGQAIARAVDHGLLGELCEQPDPPMAFACRAGELSVPMIQALLNARPELLEARMALSSGSSARPIELCLIEGDWPAARHLAERLPPSSLSGALFELAVRRVAHRDGIPLSDASVLRRSESRIPRWRAAELMLDAIGKRQPLGPRAALGAASESDEPGWLGLAVPHGDLMRYLHRLGADPNERSARGKTALHKAAASFELYSCLSLAEMGADVNALSKAGRSPMQALVSRLSDLSGQKKQGQLIALKERAIATARALLAIGADGQPIKGHSLLSSALEAWLSPRGREAAPPGPAISPLDSSRELAKVKPRAKGPAPKA